MNKLTALEQSKDNALKKMETTYKWDPKAEQYVNRKNEDDTLSPDEWNGQKQQIQNDYESQRHVATGEDQGHFDYSRPLQASQPNKAAAPAAAPAPGAVPASATPSGKPQGGQPQTKAPQPKPLTDPNVARQYLQKAGGDKNKARQLAKQDGYTF